MMYIPEVDRASEDEWSALVARADVIEIIAPGVDRVWPVVAPVHVIWGERNFRCHFPRSNPIWEALEKDSRAMVSIHGSWSYIPGGWKAPNDSSPELGVPTSFYWSVQLHCHAYVIDDPDGIAEILGDLLSKFEESPSELADPVVAHAAKLAHIRGLHLNPIEECR